MVAIVAASFESPALAVPVGPERPGQVRFRAAFDLIDRRPAHHRAAFRCPELAGEVSS